MTRATWDDVAAAAAERTGEPVGVLWAWAMPGDAEVWAVGATPEDARCRAQAVLDGYADIDPEARDTRRGYPVALVAWAPGRGAADALAVLSSGWDGKGWTVEPGDGGRDAAVRELLATTRAERLHGTVRERLGALAELGDVVETLWLTAADEKVGFYPRPAPADDDDGGTP